MSERYSAYRHTEEDGGDVKYFIHDKTDDTVIMTSSSNTGDTIGFFEYSTNLAKFGSSPVSIAETMAVFIDRTFTPGKDCEKAVRMFADIEAYMMSKEEETAPDEDYTAKRITTSSIDEYVITDNKTSESILITTEEDASVEYYASGYQTNPAFFARTTIEDAFRVFKNKKHRDHIRKGAATAMLMRVESWCSNRSAGCDFVGYFSNHKKQVFIMDIVNKTAIGNFIGKLVFYNNITTKKSSIISLRTAYECLSNIPFFKDNDEVRCKDMYSRIGEHMKTKSTDEMDIAVAKVYAKIPYPNRVRITDISTILKALYEAREDGSLVVKR